MPVHWDDVRAHEIATGDLRATRWRLGRAAGARRAGLSRWRIPEGGRAVPAHVHGDEEEIVYVLGGEGLSWQDGSGYAVRSGDVIVHRVEREAHTLLGGPVDVLVFSEGSDTHLTWLPRATGMWAGPHWIPLDAPHLFELEPPLEAPEPSPERPRTIVAQGDVEPHRTRRGRTDVVHSDLGGAAGAQRTTLHHVTVAPGAESHPPHCHSEVEELFVVLSGDGSLVLGDEHHAIRPGHVVARPPGTGVPHVFVAASGGLELLAFATRRPGDACFYPRSGTIAMPGLGTAFRAESADPWDGET